MNPLVVVFLLLLIGIAFYYWLRSFDPISEIDTDIHPDPPDSDAKTSLWKLLPDDIPHRKWLMKGEGTDEMGRPNSVRTWTHLNRYSEMKNIKYIGPDRAKDINEWLDSQAAGEESTSLLAEQTRPVDVVD